MVLAKVRFRSVNLLFKNIILFCRRKIITLARGIICVTIVRINSTLPLQKTYEVPSKDFHVDMNNLTHTNVEGSIRGWSEASQEKFSGAYGLVGIKNAMAWPYIQGGRAEHG
jgi:hypothetical protein